MELRESDFQQQIIDLGHLTRWAVAHFRSVRQLRGDGSVFYSTPVQADGAGFPDLLLLREDRLVAVELKVPGNKASAEQTAWLERFDRIQRAEAHLWYPKDWEKIEDTLS